MEETNIPNTQHPHPHPHPLTTLPTTNISTTPPPFSRIEELFKRLKLRDFRENSHHSLDSSSLGVEVKSYGVILLTCTLVFLYIYAAYVSKSSLIPSTGYWLLDEMKDDHYYCYLIPIMILPTYIVIYLNWLSMRVFESN